MNRAVPWAVLGIGLALVVVPLAISMPGRATGTGWPVSGKTLRGSHPRVLTAEGGSRA